MSTLDWSEAAADIPERGLERRRAATPEERTALATALGALSCESIDVRYRIVPRAGGRYVLDGQLDAALTRECVVSLDPVSEIVSAPLSVDFEPEGSASAEPGGTVDPFSETEIEPMEGGRLPIGRIVEEEIASRLDPYPRHPDARLEQHEAGGGGEGGAFAGLAGLKRRLEGEG